MFQIANVLQFLASSRVSGMLRLSRGSERAFVWFEEGSIVAASLLSRVLRDRPVAVSDTMTREQLEDMLGERVSTVLASVMSWPDGQFWFFGDRSPDQSAVEMPRVDVEMVLMRAAWCFDEERRAV